jgi:hypothetical protein
MKRLLIVAGFALAVVAGFGLSTAYQWVTAGRRSVTTSRLSPDETTRASMVESNPSWTLDRNFAVRLEDLARGGEVTIFQSPDEGKPPGTERLIWSKDGTKLLLVGRHFFVKEDLFLDNGDQLYFLYDLPSGKAWCNSAEETGIPPLAAERVKGVEFTEPVVLKEK